MAIISQCIYCEKLVSHSVSEVPLCEDHDGKKELAIREQNRWNALTIEQKLDELKQRMDGYLNNPPFLNTPLG